MVQRFYSKLGWLNRPSVRPFLHFVLPLCLIGSLLDFFNPAYLILVPAYVGSALYMRFWLPRQGTAIAHPRSIFYRAPQITWAFFWVNLIGWSTGAFPSLPVAYPLITMYYSFRFGALRILSTVFFLLTGLAAIYLYHHTVLDILSGWAYGIGTAFAVDAYWNWDLKRKGVIVPGPDPDPLPAGA